MKTYLINLPKNKDRLASMDTQLKKFGIDYESFAIIGAELTKKELRNKVSFVRSYLAEGRRLTIAEIGCTLSHLEAYRRILAGGLPYALILEDDVILEDDFPSALCDVKKKLDPNKPQVVLMSGMGLSQTDRESKLGCVRTKWATCCDAYCVTHKAAEVLIAQNYPIITVCDRYTRWIKRGLIEMYRYLPVTARQDQIGFKSDLGEERFKKAGKLMLPFYKIKRGMGIVLDWLLYKITGR